MPCYSKVTTLLIDLTAIEEATKSLGITVQKHSHNRITLSKGNEQITLSRNVGEKKFSTVPYSGSASWDTEILQPLIPAYAKVQVKKFAAKRGYTLSVGSQPGEYVLNSYR